MSFLSKFFKPKTTKKVYKKHYQISVKILYEGYIIWDLSDERYYNLKIVRRKITERIKQARQVAHRYSEDWIINPILSEDWINRNTNRKSYRIYKFTSEIVE